MLKMSKIDQIYKGCNAMCVRDVKDVKDRSNTPKDCNAMYVEDVGDRTSTLRAVMLCMSKMSKIDQIHLRAET